MRRHADLLARALTDVPHGTAIHVSGCAKGCAHPGSAPWTLVGRDGRYDLVRHGKAGDTPGRPRPDFPRGRDLDKPRRQPGAALTTYDYIRDGAAIYERSFAIIRAEADLSRFRGAEERVAVRIIHACGMVEAAQDIVFTPGAVEAAIAALAKGAPILCDARMVADGVTRARLPAGNDVICTLNDPARAGSRALARHHADGGRRRALARPARPVRSWRSAMRRRRCSDLLELIDAGWPRPAAIIGMPVGFVGAAELKEALLAHGGVPALVVRGRKGGSAMAAAAVNALASVKE